MTKKAKSRIYCNINKLFFFCSVVYRNIGIIISNMKLNREEH